MEYSTFVDAVIAKNQALIASFQGGRLKRHIVQWNKLTCDREVLNIVSGYKLEFSQTPYQARVPNETKFKPSEQSKVQAKLDKLLKSKVIQLCGHELGECISTIFLRKKKDGHSQRVILNLKHFNLFIVDHHFKMETLDTAINLMAPGAYAGSLDLKDAYYSIPIRDGHTKYLKFSYQGRLYQFVALPNGLKSRPLIFTKLMKIALSNLRQRGYQSAAYLDDLLLTGPSPELCQENIQRTVLWLMDLGFVIHSTKSVFWPIQVIGHIGFCLDMLHMEVRLPPEKAVSIKQTCDHLAVIIHPSIREVAHVIGTLVASFPAVPYGKLHYRCLEMDKITALSLYKGNFDRPMILSPGPLSDLQWWSQNILHQRRLWSLLTPVKLLLTDACNEGWGAVLRYSGVEKRTGGRFTTREQRKHINCKELLAVHFGLQAFCKLDSFAHIKLLVDNSTTVAYVREMGGTHSEACNTVARDIWLWAESQQNWLTISHIAGTQNCAQMLKAALSTKKLNGC